jgi:hypothetical protein
MITVTDGPIVTGIENDVKRTFDADTVTFYCQLQSTGDLSVFVQLIDSGGAVIIEYRAFEKQTSDFVIASESTTNPNTLFLREVEVQLKDFLETANPSATFTTS